VGAEDAGATGCESECREQCWELSVPHADSLFTSDRCVSTAEDFVSNLDATCLCDACVGWLHECVTNPLCYAALLCIDETRCQGAECAAVCAEPIFELSAVFSTGTLDGLVVCVADNGCE
jgi:hypothetical protein